MLTTQPKKRNALQIEKKTCKLRKQLPQFDNTHAANAHNPKKKIEKNTCKLRKHFHQFDNAHAANAHNSTKKRNALQIEKNTCKLRKTFDNLTTHMLQMLTTQPKKKRTANKMYLVVLWAFAVYFFIWAFAPSAVKMMKMFSWFAGAFSICMCFLKLQRVELSRPPYFCSISQTKMFIKKAQGSRLTPIFFAGWSKFSLSVVCIWGTLKGKRNKSVTKSHYSFEMRSADRLSSPWHKKYLYFSII